MGLFSRIGTFFGGGGPKTRISPTDTIGTIGTVVSDGFVYSPEQDPDLANPQVRFRKYGEFLLNVDVVGAGVRGFLRLVGGADWKLTPPTADTDGIPAAMESEAEDRAKIAERIIHDMRTPWFRVVRKAALYPFFGASIMEWTAKKRPDGVIGLKDISARPIHTITRWDIDEHGELFGVVQTPPADYQDRYLPRGRIVYLVADDITDAPDGVGLLRHIALPAKFLLRYLQLEGYGYETDLRGIPLARVPISAINEAVKNGDLTAVQGAEMIKFIDTFLANHLKNPELGLRLESAVYRDASGEKRPSSSKMWDLELLKGESGPHEHINVAIERQVRYIARVLGVEHLLLGGDGKGSLALSQDKSIMFAQFIESTLEDLAWTFRADVLRPIWLLNGWDEQTIPYMMPTAVALQDVLTITTALKDLASSGATMMPNDPAINEVRERLNLSPAPEMTPREMGELRAAMGGRTLQDPNAQDPNADPNSPDAQRQGGKIRAADPKRSAAERAAEKAWIERRGSNMRMIRKLTGGADLVSELRKMIRHDANGWNVYSADGDKHLGGPYPTEAEAKTRLAQVEAHKGIDTGAFLAKADGHGVVIALYPPHEVAVALSQTGGADLDALHVTVAYLGKGLDEAAIAKVMRVVQRWASEIPSIKGAFSGIGRFSASESSGGKDVAYASLDSPSLTEERPRLIDMLDRAGVPAKLNHGYVPHLTLAYIGADDPLPVRRLEPLDVEFGSIAVSAGLARIVIPFPGEDYDGYADQTRRVA